MTPTDGYVLSDDLLFTSRITGTARAAGRAVVQAKTADALLAKAASAPPACVFVDLHNPGLDLPALLDRLRAACPATPRVIAYGSHVDAGTLRAARTAGCDRVMPRSQFVQELEAGIAAWFS